MEKKQDETKESSNNADQKSSETHVKDQLDQSRPPRMQRQSRLAAKFYNNNQ